MAAIKSANIKLPAIENSVVNVRNGEFITKGHFESSETNGCYSDKKDINGNEGTYEINKMDCKPITTNINEKKINYEKHIKMKANDDNYPQKNLKSESFGFQDSVVKSAATKKTRYTSHPEIFLKDIPKLAKALNEIDELLKLFRIPDPPISVILAHSDATLQNVNIPVQHSISTHLINSTSNITSKYYILPNPPSIISQPNECYETEEGNVVKLTFTLDSYNNDDIYLQKFETDTKCFTITDDFLRLKFTFSPNITPNPSTNDLISNSEFKTSSTLSHKKKSLSNQTNEILNTNSTASNSILVTCLLFDSDINDSGSYRFEIRNGIGASVACLSSVFRISVKGQPSSIDKAPQFINNTQSQDPDKVFEITNSARLSMREFYPIPELFWFKNGFRVDHHVFNDNPRFLKFILDIFPQHFNTLLQPNDKILNTINMTADLQIFPPKNTFFVTDYLSTFVGEYICMAKNRLGCHVTFFKLALDPRGKKSNLSESVSLIFCPKLDNNNDIDTKTAESALAPKLIDNRGNIAFDTDIDLNLNSSVKMIRESITTRLFVIADENVESLEEAFNNTSPPNTEADEHTKILTDECDDISLLPSLPSEYFDHQGFSQKAGKILRTPKADDKLGENEDKNLPILRVKQGNTEDLLDDLDKKVHNKLTPDLSGDSEGMSHVRSTRFPVIRNYFYFTSTGVDKIENDLLKDEPLCENYVKDAKTIMSTKIQGDKNITEVPKKAFLPTALPLQTILAAITSVTHETDDISEQITEADESNSEIEELIKIKKKDTLNVIFSSGELKKGGKIFNTNSRSRMRRNSYSPGLNITCNNISTFYQSGNENYHLQENRVSNDSNAKFCKARALFEKPESHSASPSINYRSTSQYSPFPQSYARGNDDYENDDNECKRADSFSSTSISINQLDDSSQSSRQQGLETPDSDSTLFHPSPDSEYKYSISDNRPTSSEATRQNVTEYKRLNNIPKSRLLNEIPDTHHVTRGYTHFRSDHDRVKWRQPAKTPPTPTNNRHLYLGMTSHNSNPINEECKMTQIRIADTSFDNKTLYLSPKYSTIYPKTKLYRNSSAISYCKSDDIAVKRVTNYFKTSSENKSSMTINPISDISKSEITTNDIINKTKIQKCKIVLYK
ncbi:unnamed protein product [Gordionus sp. m RMFG-2023]|uniref:uncharacterized protein LOC135927523 isoform X2 n=1 Tax=Gordionus sp. m RMFG-2023 TaxID=3053472 RepID=UPI0030DF11FA